MEPPPTVADTIGSGEGALEVSKHEDVERVMRGIQRSVDGVEDVVIATTDGLSVSATNPGERADKVAAMAASVLALSRQAGAGDSDGDPGQTVIRGTKGCLVVQGAGPNAVIAVHTEANPNMGLIQLEVPRAAAELDAILA